ncbi:type I-B CRISPR-associated protein Cas8b1/Cst1 [Anaerosalibacter massiliensis]|uniref:Type I-B CRISPR-associated protein Cas8b1/Cst1 n=1 Tax=Anaerosalibacter massiliensis TaxID=1347392 RepID=A0A9X2ML09_9FIRM|nr:type I-B CRISPR-associated protein Cas8b1/Cst1 [Anaerosalibacter massiliensis]MCR2045102.1 type I-B CRISPR-associated protein Cas8b1/Cst1 [Anaerosalibacter massiliensis]
MGEKIRLEMGDWLYNSGLVGLYNILEKNGDTVNFDENYLEFDSEILEKFEEKYFNYFISKYEENLSWYKIVSYKNLIDSYEESDFKNFNEDSLDNLNIYISDVLKKYLKSDSYKAAYKLIESDTDILLLEKKLSRIRLKKNEKIKDKISEVKDVFNVIKIIIDYCNSEQGKKYIAGKNVIYTIIRNAWDGVCFLNPRTKEKNMYIDYKNDFINPVEEYLSLDKTKFRYNCFVCDRNMNNLKNTLSFLNQTGFDVNKKSSHVWEFNNDVAICPICKLVYSCTPAGITYVYNKGLYINDNSSMENAIDINYKVKNEILKEHEMKTSLTYRALVNSIQEQFSDKVKYELSDIQVIRFEDEKYKFNLLSRKILRVIYDSRHDLNKLIKCGFKEGNTYFNIYDLVIDSLLNNQNLFILIHKLLVYRLSSLKNCHFSTMQIVRMLNINFRFLEGIGYMENLDKYIIKQSNEFGEDLKKAYRGKKAEDKLNGIAYRLLNSLKVNNKDMFMDTVLNCYLYAQKSVPSIFLEGLKDDLAFKNIGYAFVTGLIEGKEETNKVGGDK